MKIPNVTIQQLLEAGVHLGHKTLRWNPKMKKYIFGKRDSIHIIDLTQTLELTKVALEKIYSTIVNNGKILFVSTKKQASEAIAEVAKETDQYFVILVPIFCRKRRSILEILKYWSEFNITRNIELLNLIQYFE